MRVREAAHRRSVHLYTNVSERLRCGGNCDRPARLNRNGCSLSERRRHVGPILASPTEWSIDMSFMSDLKKYAIARLKERRHRETVSFLNALPAELKKDIGWNGALDHRFE